MKEREKDRLLLQLWVLAAAGADVVAAAGTVLALQGARPRQESKEERRRGHRALESIPPGLINWEVDCPPDELLEVARFAARDAVSDTVLLSDEGDIVSPGAMLVDLLLQCRRDQLPPRDAWPEDLRILSSACRTSDPRRVLGMALVGMLPCRADVVREFHQLREWVVADPDALGAMDVVFERLLSTRQAQQGRVLWCRRTLLLLMQVALELWALGFSPAE